MHCSRKFFIFPPICFLFIFDLRLYAHNEWVHQYIVLQAWELLKQQCPAINGTILSDYIGQHGGTYSASADGFWSNASITGGAWAEDVNDPVFLVNNTNIATVSTTHFWNADNGDNSVGLLD